MRADVLLTNATVATMEPGGSPYGLMTGTTIGITGDKITYLGPPVTGITAVAVRDVGGQLITPALIDCHTHSIFGGDRIAEFEARLGGSSYEELAAAGGGILSTVRATRNTPDAELARLAAVRLGWLLRSGVGTVEVKSGYGLDPHHELRMLRVARLLGRQGPQRVVTSLLAAHTTPPEHDGVADEYVTSICEQIIPAAVAEGLVDCVDGFCETVAFSADQIARVFDAAAGAGLSVRLHADQLTDSGGAALAARYGALSADHLEHASVSGLEKMARAGTVAVLIPGASVFLNEPTIPNIPAMRLAGVAIAVSTDLNPGTSPVGSLQAAMWLATSRFRLTPEESLAGTTRHAAKALGLSDTGIVRVGMRADLALWRTSEPAALSYWTGAPLCQAVWVAGNLVFEADSDD